MLLVFTIQANLPARYGHECIEGEIILSGIIVFLSWKALLSQPVNQFIQTVLG